MITDRSSLTSRSLIALPGLIRCMLDVYYLKYNLTLLKLEFYKKI